MKAISKGSLACCLVYLDASSTNRLAQQNLQIPEHANNRTLPNWIFDARLSARDRLTSSHPDANNITKKVKRHGFGKDVWQMHDKGPLCRKGAPLTISGAFAVDAHQKKVLNIPSASPCPWQIERRMTSNHNIVSPVACRLAKPF